MLKVHVGEFFLGDVQGNAQQLLGAVRKSVGELCLVDDECTSGKCAAGRCQAGALGDPCNPVSGVRNPFWRSSITSFR